MQPLGPGRRACLGLSASENPIPQDISGAHTPFLGLSVSIQDPGIPCSRAHFQDVHALPWAVSWGGDLANGAGNPSAREVAKGRLLTGLWLKFRPSSWPCVHRRTLAIWEEAWGDKKREQVTGGLRTTRGFTLDLTFPVLMKLCLWR